MALSASSEMPPPLAGGPPATCGLAGSGEIVRIALPGAGGWYKNFQISPAPTTRIRPITPTATGMEIGLSAAEVAGGELVGSLISIKMRGSFAGFSVNLLYISGPAFLKTFRR